MDQVFALENDNRMRGLCVTDEKLLLMSKKCYSYDEFMAKFHVQGMRRWLHERREYNVADITALRHLEQKPKELVVQLGKKKRVLKFQELYEADLVADYLRQLKGFKRDVKQQNKWKSVEVPLFIFCLSLTLTYVLWDEARTLEAGGSVTVTTRNQGTQYMFIWIARQLGTHGVLIVGALTLLVAGFFSVRKWRNPPSQVVYN
ncbi:hypothetical protein [Paraflavitalea sp. CAU 1676]|uniref:hypothetical protein n=1 Tax=Paraflavitalea sp. CAU 1676 TaxID=3032598 RepID=UPI0023D9B7AC|nr:hypothetical protein [Paraflavitalea sp. CAU 1676]MDF2187833.1 hypothetical protein [Paraflavitalea sp. CAU 1676]